MTASRTHRIGDLVAARRCDAVTAAPITDDGDLVGLSITNTVGNYSDLAEERIIAFRDIDPVWRAELMMAVDAAGIFADGEPCMALTQPGARTWHVRLRIDGRSRRLVLAEPLADPEMAILLHAVRNCFPTRRSMAIDEVPPWLIELVAMSEALPESVALNHLMDDD